MKVYSAYVLSVASSIRVHSHPKYNEVYSTQSPCGGQEKPMGAQKVILDECELNVIEYKILDY